MDLPCHDLFEKLFSHSLVDSVFAHEVCPLEIRLNRLDRAFTIRMSKEVVLVTLTLQTLHHAKLTYTRWSTAIVL